MQDSDDQSCSSSSSSPSLNLIANLSQSQAEALDVIELDKDSGCNGSGPHTNKLDTQDSEQKIGEHNKALIERLLNPNLRDLIADDKNSLLDGDINNELFGDSMKSFESDYYNYYARMPHDIVINAQNPVFRSIIDLKNLKNDITTKQRNGRKKKKTRGKKGKKGNDSNTTPFRINLRCIRFDPSQAQMISNNINGTHNNRMNGVNGGNGRRGQKSKYNDSDNDLDQDDAFSDDAEDVEDGTSPTPADECKDGARTLSAAPVSRPHGLNHLSSGGDSDMKRSSSHPDHYIPNHSKQKPPRVCVTQTSRTHDAATTPNNNDPNSNVSNANEAEKKPHRSIKSKLETFRKRVHKLNPSRGNSRNNSPNGSNESKASLNRSKTSETSDTSNVSQMTPNRNHAASFDGASVALDKNSLAAPTSMGRTNSSPSSADAAKKVKNVQNGSNSSNATNGDAGGSFSMNFSSLKTGQWAESFGTLFTHAKHKFYSIVGNPLASRARGRSNRHVFDVSNENLEIVVLGRKYSICHGEMMEELLCDLFSKIWITYRKNFDCILDSTYRSDAGWGCMIRTTQMMCAQALIYHFFDYSWNVKHFWTGLHLDEKSVAKYVAMMQMFNDSFECEEFELSIHNMMANGLCFGKKVGTWFGPNETCFMISKCINATFGADAACAEARGARGATGATGATEEKEQDDVERDDNENGRIVSVVLSQTGGVLYKDDLLAKCGHFENEWKNTSLLIFVPLRLGLDRTNIEYYETILECFEFKQSIGIVGGKPQRSLYFIGYEIEFEFEKENDNSDENENENENKKSVEDTSKTEKTEKEARADETNKTDETEKNTEDMEEKEPKKPKIDKERNEEMKEKKKIYNYSNAKLFYLDPHTVFDTRKCVNHCQEINSLQIEELDPSMAVGFFIKNKEEFDAFWTDAEKKQNDRLRDKKLNIFTLSDHKPQFYDDLDTLSADDDIADTSPLDGVNAMGMAADGMEKKGNNTGYDEDVANDAGVDGALGMDSPGTDFDHTGVGQDENGMDANNQDRSSTADAADSADSDDWEKI